MRFQTILITLLIFRNFHRLKPLVDANKKRNGSIILHFSLHIFNSHVNITAVVEIIEVYVTTIDYDDEISDKSTMTSQKQ